MHKTNCWYIKLRIQAVIHSHQSTMESTPLSNLGKIKGSRRIIIECELLEQCGQNVFKISDGETEMSLEIRHENPNHSKYLEVGRKLKIVNPEYSKREKKIFVNQRTGIFQIGFSKKPMQKEDSEVFGYQTLEAHVEMDFKVSIKGKYLLKVVEIKPVRKLTTKYGPAKVLPLVVKDILGAKTILSVWSTHKPFVSILKDKVYFVSGIMTDHYPKVKPFHICSRKYFKMDLAPESLQEKFHDISFIDGSIKGTIFGIQKLYAYTSCPTCFCSIKSEDATTCEVCEEVLNSTRDDFRCILVVEKENEEEVEVIAFKKHLDFELEYESNDELEVALNQKLFGSEVELNYVTKRGSEGDIDMIVHEITFH